MDDKKMTRSEHRLTLSENHLFVSGVAKVKNVSEGSFACALAGRGFVASGSGIHILRLDVEKGEVELEGHFHAIKYTGGGDAKQSVMKRIFG